MKLRPGYILLPMMFMLFLLFPLLPGMASEVGGRTVIILSDVSGSMQKKMHTWREPEEMMASEYREESEQEDIKKVLVLKELLIRMERNLLPMTCELGIYRVRYIAGNRDRYISFAEKKQYGPDDLYDRIRDDFRIDYPLFNRRTPLADMFRQLDERELKDMTGPVTLVLVSDGVESFYNLEDDAENSRKLREQAEKEPENKEDADKKDKAVEGPLSEIFRLKRKYGDQLVIHTVFVGDTDPETRETAEDIRNFFDEKAEGKKAEGENLLYRMAWLSGGEYRRGRDLLEYPGQIAAFCAMLCTDAGQENTDEGISPVPAAPAVTLAVKKDDRKRTDLDGDGVYDDNDRCPDTPKGAKVSTDGCWILSGVLFDTDKWNIKPEFRSELDDVVRVLRENPDVLVEVQGHTDSRASAAYNIILSEKRARSVVKYLTERGIARKRLYPRGYGLTRPVSDNTTRAGRYLNRRVELQPVSGK